MADKQLNFNRPLLSVRRFSSTISSQKESRRKNENSHPATPPIPSYKPESHSGSLRNPGTVPFVWEQSPGRPKDETKTQKHAKERSPVIPKLPPGRISKHKKQDLDIITENSNATKGLRTNPLGSQSVLHTEEKLTKFESSKETKNQKSDDGDDGDDMFMDALDTPAQAEPFYNSNIGVIKEKPREAKKVVNRETEKPQLAYGPNFLQFTAHDSEADSDFDYDEHENMSYKVCGLLPHFCLKGSIGLLNPVPALSVRTRLPVSSLANRTRNGSSSATSQPARVTISKHKSSVKHQKHQTVLKNESAEATNPKTFKKLDRSGLHDNLQGRGISYNLTESSPPPPPVSEQKEVNLANKGLVSFKELLAEEDQKEADTQNPSVEKTVYIDTIHKTETATKEKSNFKEHDKGIFVISHHPTESLQSHLFAEKPKQDQEMKMRTGFCKVSQQSGLELPATPPLPKSPSDSWLWRTLPSVSSKTPSLRSNPQYPSSKTATKFDKNAQPRYPQGLLLPIPET